MSRAEDTRVWSRVVPFAVNTRDLGGLRGPGNGYVRPGLLYRGSAGAIEPLVRRRGLRTVVDLRSESESGDGRGRSAGLDVLARPVVGDRAVIKQHGDPRPSDYLAYYRQLVPLAVPIAVDLIDVLADPARLPVLVCCSVGKDRTSVVCALGLRAIGIRLADVVRDHALSSRLLHRDGCAARNVAWARKLTRREFDVRTTVVGWTIGRLLMEVERTYGSTVGLLATHGLEPSTVTTVRDVLLGSAPW
jgi:protein-tyrosine phosphatase